MKDTKSVVTVRSYNNNEWAMLVAAGQITLKPSASAMIASGSDQVKLVWKRGESGSMKPFGTEHLSQSAAPKDEDTIFIIGDANTL